MNAEEFAARLNGKRTGTGWAAKCPAHEDRNASLSITAGDDGKTLLRCHAGCTFADVVAAAGLRPGDLFPPKPASNASVKPRIVATYPYHDEAGTLLFEVVRFEPKDFRQRQPDGAGWKWNLQGVRRVLYRLPQVIEAVSKGLPLFLVEGEKDVAALAAQGIAATCNSGGAGKWIEDYNAHLQGANVCIVADKDKPGRAHAREVAASLHGIAASVRVVEVPDHGGKPCKDASDFLTAGGTAADLLALADATPEWQPSAETTQAKAESSAASAADIRGQILAILTNGKLDSWEKRARISEAVNNAMLAAGSFYRDASRCDFHSTYYFHGTTKRLERIGSDAFAAGLSHWLAVNRTETLFAAILSAVQTYALSGEQSRAVEPESFWASREGALYLSNGDGQAVKITPGKVVVCDNGTDGVLFAAGRTLAPWKLTTPSDPFDCALVKGANCVAEHGRDLLRLWVYGLATNPRSKPPLCLAGDIGSGKTRTAKWFAELYGFPFIAAKVEESGEGDFWPNLDAGGLYALDNADTRCRWLPDAIAAAATDGCSQRRKLYTNSETVLLRARAWLAITSANPSFASDAGLADRLLVVRLGRREGATADAALTAEILAKRDAGLSHVAQTLAAALADTAPTPEGLNARHPDWAAFAVKIGRALGREAEAVAAVQAAEADKSAFCLENDSIGAALLAYVRHAGSYHGSAGELVPHLVAVDTDLAERLTAKRLGKRLSALWPHVQKAFAVARRETDRNGTSVFTFKSDPSAGFAGFQTLIP